ncbi:MAG TPA: hypothetical protein VJH92_02845, partial [Candidatus Nanoarchaeia archaeon]|nr:hypothetical protein [Candidatus Nanoarchaeia archaeon]
KKRKELITEAFKTDDIDMPETKTVFTVVQFDFLDEPIEIAHFNPQSEKDIELGISNRYISEKRAFDNREK